MAAPRTNPRVPGSEAYVEEWSARAENTNGIASAAKSAVAGSQYFVTGVLVGVSAATAAPVRVTIKDGAGTKSSFLFDGTNLLFHYLPYDIPWAGAVGNAVSVDVAAAGIGIISIAEITGFTLPL